MTPEEHADNICRWTNPALRERVIGEIRAALAETWRTMTTDPAREAARLACDLCHCCGEQRHDGGDPCVSCASAVTKEREVILALQPPEKRTISGNPSFVAGVRAGWSDCLNAIRARTP